MKRKTMIIIGSTLVLLMCSLLLLVESKHGQEVDRASQASREWVADTFDELMEESDVVLLGQVIGQTPHLRADMVFTYQNVRITEVLKGNVIGNQQVVKVLQTGGSFNGQTTAALLDDPLMTTGEHYLLFLTFSPPSDKYPAHYYLPSGGQCVMSYSEMAAIAREEGVPTGDQIATIYAMAEEVFLQKGRVSTCAINELSTGHWDIGTEQSLDIPFHIVGANSFSSSFITNVSQGVFAWNANEYIYFYRSLSEIQSGMSLLILPEDYGDTGWDGICEFKCNNGEYSTQNYDTSYTNVRFMLNTSRHQGEPTSVWKGVSAHEVGHAMGLAHTDDTSSIMIAKTIEREVLVPSSGDIQEVDDLYASLIVPAY